MRRWAVCLLLLLALLPAALSAQTQAAPLDQAAFWSLLQQTDQQVQAALDQGAAVNPDLLASWQSVSGVRVGAALVVLDLRWITEPLASGDPARLKTLDQHVRALLDYHAQTLAEATQGGASQAALDQVLRDPRFQYTDLTPTPIPTAQPDTQSTPVEAPSGLAQMLLVAGGVILVIAFLVFLLRRLNVTPVALDSGTASDEPTTSDAASDRAADFASTREYRSAIRYLYLACLLRLDERGLIRYDATLTNREHLRQVSQQPQLYDLLRSVVNAFEDVWYGYAAVDESFYQQFRREIDQLDRLVL